MSKVKAVALITEDETDYWPVRIYIERIAGLSTITFKPKFGNGSGKLVGKCLAWSREMAMKGCNLLVIVHDLDKNDLNILRKDLESRLKDSPIANRYVCVPVQELEAWFLADPESIQKAFGFRKAIRSSGLPETIVDPKEKLEAIVYSYSDKTMLYTTVRGKDIALHTDIDKVRGRAASFQEFHDFISSQQF